MRHFGGCHCEKVKFEVDMDLVSAISCNCSVCTKRGSLLSFVPDSKFKLLSGEEDLTEYKFNKKRISHLFCKHCGILSFGKTTAPDGAKVTFINVRCIEGIDVSQLTIQQHNGRDL